MDQAILHIAQLSSIDAVLMHVQATGHRFGVLRQSYHFTPLFHSPVSADTIIYADGYSPDWQTLYHNKDFRLHDPIPGRTLAKGRMLSWADAIAMGAETPEQQEYFDAMERHGLKYGTGLPLFGPSNRTAYASFDFGRPMTAEDEITAIKIRAVAQTAHLRICEIFDRDLNFPPLSEREQEVMKWIARGKSNTDIGTIIGISPETVRTYTKRIYEKLEASDRVGATIKALKLGIVTF